MEAGIEQIESKERDGRTYRAALAAVIFLSCLMGLAIIALIVLSVREYRLYKAGPSAPVAARGAAASLQLAPGAHIVSVGSDAGKLILHVRTPAGGEVDVIDLSTGKLSAIVKDGAK